MDVKKKWRLLCTSEWPTLNSTWPKDGTFNLDVILQIKERVFSPEPQGCPDQIPSIITWESLARDPPAWVSPFVSPQPSAPQPPSSSTPLQPTPSPDASLKPQPTCLYPILEKPKPKPIIPKPVLPPLGGPLIDLLTEDPPPTISASTSPGGGRRTS